MAEAVGVDGWFPGTVEDRRLGADLAKRIGEHVAGVGEVELADRAAVSAAPGEVILAVDPHKASWAAVVMNSGSSAVAAIRVDVNRAGYRQLQRFAAAWPQAQWAVEGAVGLGAPLTERLRADGIAVIDVPAKLARRS